MNYEVTSLNNRDGYTLTEIGDLPDSWEITKLENICKILDSKRKPIKSSERIPGKYPYYGASGIIDMVQNYIFDEDIILLGEDGENILSRNLPLAFRVSGKCWVNNHAHVFSLYNNNRDNIDFMTWVLESKDYTSIAVGSAQPKITQDHCRNSKIQRPPYPEQRRIADILSTVDEHITETRSLIEKTKVLKQGMMQQLLTKGIGHTEFKDTEIGRIPTEWDVCRFGDICSSRTEKYQPTNDDNKQYIALEDIDQNTGRLLSIGNSSESASLKTKFMEKDVLFGKLRPYLRKYWLAAFDGVCSTEILVFRATEQNSPQFLMYTVEQESFIEQVTGKSYGSKMPRASWDDISNILVASPRLEEQKQIGRILYTIDEQLDLFENKKMTLSRLKSALMQQLLTGKIRVNV